MADDRNDFDDLSSRFRDAYTKRNVLMSFQEYLKHVTLNPRKFMRNSSQYLIDTFNHFGTETVSTLSNPQQARFQLFNIGTERSGPIIGGESAQNEFYYILKNFARNGFSSLLTLFHGPNGSAKSSTVETIANAMEAYSKTDDGAIYKFNWIFPTDKDTYPAFDGQGIGFQKMNTNSNGKTASFALFEEAKISAKLSSEFKENPLFLLPMPYREEILRRWLAKSEGSNLENVALPPHILASGLSKKNQEIFEHLLNAYNGDLDKVFRHVQIERFFFSKQYRIGISAVEPQMSIDAYEKQLTLDRSYSNLPSILHSINFHQNMGPLVEANRGLLEFSDLLKRPVETFKYLISTIEKASINLPSGTTALDIIFVATTNDKHLDGFKGIPDFSSFKGRFELVTVPYLLVPEQEEKIFTRDIAKIQKLKFVTPHSLRILCTWGVLTRLKQPDPEKYPQKYKSLISRLDPWAKLSVYRNMQEEFSRQDWLLIKEVRDILISESQRTLIYEGRFGASPRELRAILHKAANNSKYTELSPMAVFEEIENLVKDRTVYEFLQFESRARYHDVNYFIEKLKEDFSKNFESEVIQSMSIAKEDEYLFLLERYVTHVVAQIKNEKLWDETSHTYIPPSPKIMGDVEQIIAVDVPVADHRNILLNRIAAFRIENPHKEIKVGELFQDHLSAIKQHFYNEKRKVIEANYKAILAIESGEPIREEEKTLAKTTLNNMEKQFGYSQSSIYNCLKFILKFKSSQKEPARPIGL